MQGMDSMLYFRVSVIAVSALGLLVYTIIFDRKYLLKLLAMEVVLAGFLSFYLFYNIYSYTGSDTDTELIVDTIPGENGVYTVKMNVKWNTVPELLWFSGSDDMLILRYNPESFDIVSTDSQYSQTVAGETLLDLPKEYKYYGNNSKEKEMGFSTPDGSDISVKITIRCLSPGECFKVFFIHDHKLPLDSSQFIEKMLTVKLE